MYMLMLISSLFASSLDKEKIGIQKLNHTLDSNNFWVYSQEDISNSVLAKQYYNSNNMFLVFLDHDNNDLKEIHKKQISDVLKLMVVNNMISLCKNSYSYIIFYNEKIDIEYFKSNANKFVSGGFYYKAITSGANMFFIDDKVDINNNDLINFYLNNCKFEIK